MGPETESECNCRGLYCGGQKLSGAGDTLQHSVWLALFCIVPLQCQDPTSWQGSFWTGEMEGSRITWWRSAWTYPRRMVCWFIFPLFHFFSVIKFLGELAYPILGWLYIFKRGCHAWCWEPCGPAEQFKDSSFKVCKALRWRLCIRITR